MWPPSSTCFPGAWWGLSMSAASLSLDALVTQYYRASPTTIPGIPMPTNATAVSRPFLKRFQRWPSAHGTLRYSAWPPIALLIEPSMDAVAKLGKISPVRGTEQRKGCAPHWSHIAILGRDRGAVGRVPTQGHRFFVNSVTNCYHALGGFPHGEPCGLGRCRGRQLPRAHFAALHLRSSRCPSFGIESPGCEKVTARSCQWVRWPGRTGYATISVGKSFSNQSACPNEGSRAKQYRPHSASPPVERANSAHSRDRDGRVSWRAKRATILSRM
jgi:hypothetical protein